MIELIIINKTFPEHQISQMNPVFIPRIGDKVDMGYEPACTVTNILWQYHNGIVGNKDNIKTHFPTDIDITVIVE